MDPSPSLGRQTDHGDILIRMVRPDDYEALVDFLCENNKPEVTRQFHPFPLTSETAYQIACTKHLDRYYVALLGDRIVGLCMLRGWDEGFEIPSFGVVVDYRFHNLSIGKQMTEFAMPQARKLGCSRLRLSVYASNTVALHLYESHGFRERTRKSVLVAGEPDEKIVMFKDL